MLSEGLSLHVLSQSLAEVLVKVRHQFWWLEDLTAVFVDRPSSGQANKSLIRDHLALDWESV